jgi:hypothetical protein
MAASCGSSASQHPYGGYLHSDHAAIIRCDTNGCLSEVLPKMCWGLWKKLNTFFRVQTPHVTSSANHVVALLLCVWHSMFQLYQGMYVAMYD